MKYQTIEDQARNAWIAGATMKHIASVLNVSVQKATAIIHKGASMTDHYPNLAQDQLWELHDYYRNAAHDTALTAPQRRLARIEAIHLADELDRIEPAPTVPTLTQLIERWKTYQ